ncbi:hypothetical protein [Fuerstiella marisgermanici]|uniref:Uncharacterized protein n=1 Tax=Fuerstiella marisgermanici TaxID=1891926 RepID=A0A1P8WIH6_9PLAN|nr:hypothetical protein [Fuerstiella marisgermanici]APZ93859.1 hypothetical protein Fuma_03477 [Fuerstiella marisgermanici]
MKTASCLLGLFTIFASVGCMDSLLNQAKMEERIVQQFADAVSEENETALRRIASARFEQKAMASDDALTDLRVVHLPTGELTVVEVKESEDGRRDVVVKEESGGKYQFQLVRDDSKGYWVVDDVVVRQRKNGTRVAKSTIEVMDLLVTLRQFLDVWKTGSRDEILAMTSPELSASLEPLPDKWLQALTAKIASTYEDGMARKPEANLNDNEAVVKLPAKNGYLYMKIVRGSEGWLVNDVEAISRSDDDHPGSVRRQADAINAVNAFLTAYGAEDQDALQMVAGKELYESALKLSDLSLVQLPSPNDVPAEFVIRAYESQLTLMIPAGKEIVRMHLQEREEGLPNVAATAASDIRDRLPRFTVEEVTLYELATERQRTLSAVFTAPMRASVFLKALSERNHKRLSHLSTGEFSRATWNRVSPEILQQLDIPDFYDDGVKVTDGHTFGDTTELEFVNAKGRVFSCRMINQNGELRLDDVQYPNEQAQVTSLKTQLELTVPILEFATAWRSNDLELLQKSCSSDFNRLVWTHMDGVPQQFGSLDKLLSAPVSKTNVTQERATVRLRQPGSNAQLIAKLVTEYDFWVVDEIQTEASPGQLLGVRDHLRGQIAARLRSGSYSTVHSADGVQKVMPVHEQHALRSTDDAIQQASAEFSFGEDNSSVNHAVFHQYYEEGEERPTAHPAPVHPASDTNSVLPGPTGQNERRSGIVTAGHQRTLDPASEGQDTSSAARTASGVQVFGPHAEKVAEALDAGPAATQAAPAGLPSSALTTPIDMTPAAKTAPKSGTATGNSVSNPPANTKSHFMHFGPDANNATNADKPRRISEPADAPIAID